MNAAQFTAHLTSLKDVIPESALAYAAELGVDDGKRAEIAAFLTTQAQAYAKSADMTHKAATDADDIRAKLAKLKKD